VRDGCQQYLVDGHWDHRFASQFQMLRFPDQDAGGVVQDPEAMSSEVRRPVGRRETSVAPLIHGRLAEVLLYMSLPC
jgi:hypothetical protein